MILAEVCAEDVVFLPHPRRLSVSVSGHIRIRPHPRAHDVEARSVRSFDRPRYFLAGSPTKDSARSEASLVVWANPMAGQALFSKSTSTHAIPGFNGPLDHVGPVRSNRGGWFGAVFLRVHTGGSPSFPESP